MTVEESQSFGIETELTEGMQFDKGYVSPYMVTNPERMEAEYKTLIFLLLIKKLVQYKRSYRYWRRLPKLVKRTCHYC